MQIPSVVLWTKMSEIKDAKQNVQECVIYQYFAYNCPQLPGYKSLYCESMGILCVLDNSLLALHRIRNQSLNNNLST